MEFEPDGKAADDVRQIYEWTCRQLNLSTHAAKKSGSKATMKKEKTLA
jgi:chromosome partitioning protein